MLYIPQAGDKIRLAQSWTFTLPTSAAQITAKRFEIGKTRRIRRVCYVYLRDRPVYASQDGHRSPTTETQEYRSFYPNPEWGELVREEDQSYTRHEWRDNARAILPKGTELTVVRPPRYYHGRCTNGLTLKVTNCPNKKRTNAIFTISIKVAQTMRIRRR
jgi:hypothetical protein